jgi:hypothetical protein
LADLLSRIIVDHGGKLAAVLPACSFLVDGVRWSDRAAPLPQSATVDVLPPFAGG